MAVEVNDLLKLIGFEPPEEGEFTIADVRNTVESHFIPRDEIESREDILEPIISKHIGKHLGAAQTALISEAKKAGFEFAHNDFKDKKLVEIVPTIFGAVSEKLAGAKKPDSKLTEEVERWKGEYTELKTGYESMQAKMQELQSGFEQEKQQWEINHIVSEDWKKVKLDPNVDTYKRRGFEVEFNEKYALQKFDDGIWPVYRDGAKKGSRVKSSDAMTKALSHEELLMKELEAANMLAKPHQGKPTRPAQVSRNGNGAAPNEGAAAVKVHPAFLGGNRN